MASSTARKKKRAGKTALARAQRKANGKGTELADASEVRKAFAQVNQQFQGLVRIHKHNNQVTQQGFYRNDIWLECFKNVLNDMALGKVRMHQEVKSEPFEGAFETIDPENDGAVIYVKQTGIDWESYWKPANEEINRQMEAVEAEKAARNHEPEDPVIERDPEDQVVEFGGDVEPDELNEEEESDEGIAHAEGSEATA
jgi:hypothetical protein